MTTVSPRLHPFHARTLAGLLILLSASAQAQTSYTMTVLSKPPNSAPAQYLPMHINADGSVQGSSNAIAGLTFGPGGKLAYSFYPQMVSWAAGKGASVPATVIIKKYDPILFTEAGLSAGLTQNKARFSSGVLPLTGQASLVLGFERAEWDTSVKAVVQSGTTFTPISTSERFTPAWMNSQGVLVGSYFDHSPEVSQVVAAVYDKGVLTKLDNSGFIGATATYITDDGLIGGGVTKDVREPGAEYPVYTPFAAIWVNGRPQPLVSSDDKANASSVVTINKARQVLLRGYDWAVVWADGKSTPIKVDALFPGLTQLDVRGMNNLGVVVGCAWSDNTIGPQPFMWKDGVATDLSKLWHAQGVKLAAGRTFGCAQAINDSGAILTYHWKFTDTSTYKVDPGLVWVRLSPQN